MFKPNYTITTKILNSIAQIEASRQIIENAPLIPQWERKFVEDALIRSIHHSTHIEGNPLSEDDARKIYEGKAEELRAGARDIQEILNYRTAMDYIDSLKDKEAGITESMILRLHSILAKNFLPLEYSGKYRNVRVSLRNSQTMAVTFTPPPKGQVKPLMDDFIGWVNDTGQNTPPVIKAGLIHYEVARVHPFADLNGRTSRALATLSLYLDGYDIKRFFSLDEYYDRDPKSYYEALKSVPNSGGEHTQWLEYFSTGLAGELSQVKTRVLKLSADYHKRQKKGQIFLTERQERLIQYLEENVRFVNKDFGKIFPGISDDTVLRELNDLVKKKIIRKRGRTKSAAYELR
ncbi:MAG: Fic family protein [bacterium]